MKVYPSPEVCRNVAAPCHLVDILLGVSVVVPPPAMKTPMRSGGEALLISKNNSSPKNRDLPQYNAGRIAAAVPGDVRSAFPLLRESCKWSMTD